jgi:hypothetical protein
VLWCRFCGKNKMQYRSFNCDLKSRMKKIFESVSFYGVAVALMVGGVFAETYINNPILKMLVKNF